MFEYKYNYSVPRSQWRIGKAEVLYTVDKPSDRQNATEALPDTNEQGSQNSPLHTVPLSPTVLPIKKSIVPASGKETFPAGIYLRVDSRLFVPGVHSWKVLFGPSIAPILLVSPFPKDPERILEVLVRVPIRRPFDHERVVDIVLTCDNLVIEKDPLTFTYLDDDCNNDFIVAQSTTNDGPVNDPIEEFPTTPDFWSFENSDEFNNIVTSITQNWKNRLDVFGRNILFYLASVAWSRNKYAPALATELIRQNVFDPSTKDNFGLTYDDWNTIATMQSTKDFETEFVKHSYANSSVTRIFEQLKKASTRTYFSDIEIVTQAKFSQRSIGEAILASVTRYENFLWRMQQNGYQVRGNTKDNITARCSVKEHINQIDMIENLDLIEIIKSSSWSILEDVEICETEDFDFDYDDDDDYNDDYYTQMEFVSNVRKRTHLYGEELLIKAQCKSHLCLPLEPVDVKSLFRLRQHDGIKSSDLVLMQRCIVICNEQDRLDLRYSALENGTCFYQLLTLEPRLKRYPKTKLGSEFNLVLHQDSLLGQIEMHIDDNVHSALFAMHMADIHEVYMTQEQYATVVEQLREQQRQETLFNTGCARDRYVDVVFL